MQNGACRMHGRHRLLLLQTGCCSVRAWSLGSLSWRHLTNTSMASRQPKLCCLVLPLAPELTLSLPPLATCTSTSHAALETTLRAHSCPAPL